MPFLNASLKKLCKQIKLNLFSARQWIWIIKSIHLYGILFSLNSMAQFVFYYIILELFGRYEWFIRNEFHEQLKQLNSKTFMDWVLVKTEAHFKRSLFEIYRLYQWMAKGVGHILPTACAISHQKGLFKHQQQLKSQF